MGIDPGTLAIASTVLGGLQTGMQIMGNVNQGRAQAQAANYQAQVAANNAQMITQQGIVAAEQQQQKTAALIGGQRAAYGASGVDVNSGSSLDVQASTAMLGRLNTDTTLYNANVEARNATAQSALLSREATYDTQAGWMNASSSALGGATNVADRWIRYSQAGIQF